MWNREEFEEPARITTRVERQLAVSHWLLSASREVEGARAEWAEIGLTVLRCGTLFGAVRVPAEIIHAAAGSHQDDAVNAYLARALHGGPVLVDTHQERYYALVPPGTMHHWNTPDTECLGRGSYLGVPAPRPRWALGSGRPLVLVSADGLSGRTLHAGVCHSARRPRPIQEADRPSRRGG